MDGQPSAPPIIPKIKPTKAPTAIHNKVMPSPFFYLYSFIHFTSINVIVLSPKELSYDYEGKNKKYDASK